ncbi:hypothetical protein [Kordia sp.]
MKFQQLNNAQLSKITGGETSQNNASEDDTKYKGKRIPAGTGLRHYL